MRKFVLERDCYLCQCRHCKALGRVRAAGEVDHVVSKAEAKRRGWTQQQTDHPDNLQAINSDCHKVKTIEDSGGKAPVRVGLDGWPIA